MLRVDRDADEPDIIPVRSPLKPAPAPPSAPSVPGSCRAAGEDEIGDPDFAPEAVQVGRIAELIGQGEVGQDGQDGRGRAWRGLRWHRDHDAQTTQTPAEAATSAARAIPIANVDFIP